MLTLSVMPYTLAVIRFNPASDISFESFKEADFFSITKTDDELSIVCTEDKVPPNAKLETGWNCLKVEGPLDFALTGVLSSLISPLAESKISIFAISTFDTDYILIKKEKFKEAVAILRGFCKIQEAGG